MFPILNSLIVFEQFHFSQIQKALDDFSKFIFFPEFSKPLQEWSWKPVETKKEREIGDTLASIKEDVFHSFRNDVKAYRKQNAHTKDYHYLTRKEFDQFYNKLTKVLKKFDEKDMNTIGTGKESPAAKEWLDCFRWLEEHGLQHVQKEPINFWSGSAAKRKARRARSCSDSDIPAIRAMFRLTGAVWNHEAKTNRDHLTTILPNAVSAAYASRATGVANVYVSSDKKSEPFAGLTIGNNFWLGELPILQRMVKSGQVEKILIHRKTPGGWKGPIDFNDFDASKHIIVRRREAQEGDKHPEAFYPKKQMTKKQLNEWKETSPARPATTLGKLRSIGEKFFKNAWGSAVA